MGYVTFCYPAALTSQCRWLPNLLPNTLGTTPVSSTSMQHVSPASAETACAAPSPRIGNRAATLPSGDCWLRPCSCPAPRQVSRSPLAKLRAAGTSELLPASALRCEDRECIVTIGTREARKNCGRASASQLGKIHLGHVSDGIYNKGDIYTAEAQG